MKVNGVLELENPHSVDRLRQELSIDAKSRGRFLMRTTISAWIYSFSPTDCLLVEKKEKNPSNYIVEKLGNTLTPNENNLFFKWDS